MLSEKLITLLESFNGHDLSQFRKFLCSPFFNENEVLVRLFDLLDAPLREPPSNGRSKAQQLKKKDVWRNLYGNEPFQDAKLRRLCSELTQQAFSFIAAQQHRRDPLHEITHTLPVLSRPHLAKHFRGLVRQAEKVEEKQGLRNTDFHYNRFLIESCHHHFREGDQQKIGGELGHLEQADFHLDCFYFTQKLKHYCDALDYQKVVADAANVHLPPAFLDYLSDSPYQEEVSVKVYYWITRMLLHPEDEQAFHRLKKLLAGHRNHFSRQELRSLYLYLINYCIDTGINAGHQEYFRELFEIYREVIRHQIIIENNTINPQDYKNIITVGLHTREFHWVEAFIQQYTSLLPKEEQENAFTYNLAKVYFHQRKYGKVIEQLREVEYKSQVYALGGKLMLLKTYYELNEFLALDSLIDSFRIYLRRHRGLSREVRQQYMNVLRFVKKLSRVDPYNKQDIQKIEKQIEECGALAAKSWLLEKAGELAGN